MRKEDTFCPKGNVFVEEDAGVLEENDQLVEKSTVWSSLWEGRYPACTDT